ncbi:MAG: EAL domain-containing protein [Magnetococcales bacterium]|nr:EAL domain-containing protein [Magnetococcales bacterium]
MTAGTGLYGGKSLEVLEKSIHEEGGVFFARYQDKKVGTGFQRVFSFVHQRQVGFEAFFQGVDDAGRVIPSADIFAGLTNPDDALQMDRMRLILHVKNFVSAKIDDRWLFINIQPKAMVGRKEPDISFFHDVLRKNGLPTHQVVVMLREHPGENETVFKDLVKEIRDLGCLVLFDDFNGAAANLDHLWQHNPDIVKLQRTAIENASKSKKAKRMLSRLVSLLHASGALVLMEKIETEDEAFLARKVEADFCQGKYWGAHVPRPVRWNPGDTPGSFHGLISRAERKYFQDLKHNTMEMGIFSGEFQECAWSVADGVPLETAAQPLLGLDRVLRVYLLDHKGVQNAESVYPPGHQDELDKRFKPIQQLRGATVAHRSGFQDSVREPGKVHMSQPYRSIASLQTVTTLTVTVVIDGQTNILCCDVLWREEAI